MKNVNEEIRALADRIKARDVRRVVYFHCDHFEPWQNLAGHGPVSERHVEDLMSFAEDLARIDYARKLTLFYRPRILWRYSDSTTLLRAHPDDPLGFYSPPPNDARIAKEGMGYLARNSQHDLQFHLHHEGLTYNTSHKDPTVLEFYQRPDAREIDNFRIATALELLRKAIRDEAGVERKNWFFVHGHWALQASDGDTCWITNEIDILMKAGCLGDFTFPAGRDHVNPLLEQPYFCKPIDMAKGYDSVEAEPEFAHGNAEAAKSKFFIWSSRIKHNRSSIDYYAEWVRKNLEAPEQWARDIVDLSVAIDGTLYVKTHSHSMAPYYRELKRRPIYPHAHPGVQTLLGLVFDAAASAGCAVEFKTVGEVYAEFCNGRAPVESTTDAGSEPATTVAAGGAGEQHSATSLTEIARRLDEIAVPFVTERINRLGMNESGAYNYYYQRTIKNTIVSPAELAVAEFLLSLPRFDEYHEIGSGLGTLVVLLRLAGLNALGVEVDTRRYECATEMASLIHRSYGDDNDILPANIFGFYPAAVRDREKSKSLVISTNFVATTSDEAKADILTAMSTYKAALIDIDYFFEKRTDDGKRNEILSMMRSFGLHDGQQVTSLRGFGNYYLFQR